MNEEEFAKEAQKMIDESIEPLRKEMGNLIEAQLESIGKAFWSGVEFQKKYNLKQLSNSLKDMKGNNEDKKLLC